MKDIRRTDSGIEIQALYQRQDVERDPEPPGSYPFTRGVYESMYRGRVWTMRQYAGFGSARETNTRFRYLLEQGQTGLSVAFDLPTQLGLDSDDPLALGEVGRTGVAISSLEDMATLLEQIPLDQVSTSMTINAPAAALLLMYELLAEQQGLSTEKLRGTIQNDILKEYVARGTFIFSPQPSMRLTVDIFRYCKAHLPKWNTISISGYHIREAGATAVEEIAFTLANGIAYVEAALEAGLEVDEFAPRLSFFFNAHNNLFEEVAKFRAARRIWAHLMKERFGAQDPRSMMLRFHTQTAGATLTAQQPLNNIVRVTLQTLAATLGGTQSLHTNSFDEALALPSRQAATVALRTQQIAAHEGRVIDTSDPLGGSYYVESLTDEIEARAGALIEEVDRLGGAVPAIEGGFVQKAISDSAYAYQMAIEEGSKPVVGVNVFQMEEEQGRPDLLRVDEAAQQEQIERLRRLRAARDQAAVDGALQELRRVAQSDGNLLYPMKRALGYYATLGEVFGVLREVFGQYRAPTIL
ncbi:MAG: methylmalonyl-CoA mutase [Chloroflexia bacterium]|nr:methylmalonyl-CoA mutase [Chloroflexia bacterium]